MFFEILIPTLVFFLSLYVSLLVSVSAHEFGHAFAALVLGYEVEEINLGIQSRPIFDISLKRHVKKIHISLYPFCGEMCLSQNKKTMTSFQRFIFLIAGPLGNILVAGVLFFIFVKKPTSPLSISFWDYTLYSILLLNFLTGLFNLIPGDESDGSRALEVITGKYAKRVALKNKS
ncbi:MAG: M50 family metallopeptidase [Candidatus Yanofskybacteria bacterium]|nr:M50 family metallopeptidase [Candidatus Yanofskybacteria bacterium]